MEAAVMPRGSGKQAGYTLIEIIVALSVLSIGSAVLWYTLRSSSRLERMNRLHHEANLLARSELEAVRTRPRHEVKDTTYDVTSAAGGALTVERMVFDSAKVFAALEEIALDETLAPQELRKPLEVRVRVYEAAGEGEGASIPDAGLAWDGAASGGAAEGRRILSSLVLKIPEYRWH
jgi:prepilin-type N-terminal cleavage/methylation domain-containing protein